MRGLAIRLSLTLVLIGALLFTPLGASAPQLFGVAPAQAQERPKTLFGILFGNRRQQERAQPQQRRTTQPRRASRPAQRSTRRATVPAGPPPVEKNENARKVLIVGDFAASGLAEGLQTAYAQDPNILIKRRTNGSSGLVRDDYYDWPASIGAIVEEEQPAVIVIQLGSNDRQVMRVEGATRQVRSDEWTTEYNVRINALLDEAAQAQVPLIWVGAPPFRFTSMTADMLAFNGMYSTAVEDRGGVFVDIWDGFVDEEGKFITSGADIKGQTAQLRASDGINFTRAGKRKMAFYVERQLQLLFGDGSGAPLVSSIVPEGLKLPPLETETDLERTNPIALLDPELDGGAILLGVRDQPDVEDNPLQAKSVRQRLIEDGSPPPPQPGRAGNFRLPSAEPVSAVQPEVLTLPPTPPEL